jgi:RNA polymerase sigma factor (sigma-70 family)
LTNIPALAGLEPVPFCLHGNKVEKIVRFQGRIPNIGGMTSALDMDLLRDFAAFRKEAAFRELVARHLDHVHSVARRVTNSHDLAADVAQQVFIRLAQLNGMIPRGVPLSSWLHLTTRSLAIDLVRAETARRRREQKFAHHDTMHQSDNPDWSALEPVIDEAVASLCPDDREAILLRFYQKRSHAEAGRSLQVSEDAARMKVNRALEKLRTMLLRKGITTTTAALAVTLPAYTVSAAPAPLAATIASAALSFPSKAAASSTKLFAMTKMHIAAIAAASLAVPLAVFQFSQNAKLREELLVLRPGQIPQVLPANAANSSADSRPASTPTATLQEILAMRDPMLRIKALIDFVGRVPVWGFSEAVRELREGSPDWDPEAKMLGHMLLTRWAREDPDGAFAGLNQLQPKQAADASSLLASLAAADPARAAEWLRNPENPLVDFPDLGHILAGTVGKEWVRQDLDAALAWAASLPETQRAGAYVGVLGTFAGTDPAAAARLAGQLEPGDARLNIVGDISRSWAKKSPEQAMMWAQSLDGTEHQNAFRDIFRTWATTQPTAAARFLDGIPTESITGELLKAVAEPWSTQAPTEAAAWIMARPEGLPKDEALRGVMWSWTKQNPVDASSWLSSQPAGRTRDSGIEGLVVATFDSDPAGALTWANSISEDTQRAAAITAGMATWLGRDPQAAETWAAENGMPLPHIKSK